MKTQQRRATVYLDSHLHRALRLKAAETDRSVSEIVNEAVRQSLSDNVADVAAKANLRTLPKSQPVAQPTLAETLARYIGIVDGMPADWAKNHDHYIHGARKK